MADYLYVNYDGKNSSSTILELILAMMREAQQGEIFIKEIDEVTLKSLITFIYTGDFEFDQSKIRAEQ